MRDFPTLFQGRDDVHGSYSVPLGTKPSAKGKLAGRAFTRREPVTDALFAAHLRGEQRLGMVPIIPEVNHVHWLALDVDEYKSPTLYPKVCKKIAKLGLPLLVTRTKSGGLHLWNFFRDPIPARKARDIGADYIKKLGLNPKTEIFPKQDTIRAEDDGSWINLPYFGGTCVGLDDDANELTLDEFLQRANESLSAREDLKTQRREAPEVDDEEEAPPCVVTMMRDGIEEGGRDNALMHMGVYLAKAYPDDWEDRLGDINDESVHPPLGSYDLGKIVKSLHKKNYQYLCKQQPMCALCDKSTCLTRKFGIGTGEAAGAAVIFDALEKLDGEEPIYRVTMSGRRFQVDAATLFRFSAFQIAAMKAIDRILPTVKQAQWMSIVQDQLATMEISKAPVDTQTRDRIVAQFKEWAHQHAMHSPEVIVESGLPFYDGKSVFFRGNDFMSLIDKQFRITRQDVWVFLRDWGVVEDKLTVNGNAVPVWRYPIEAADKWFDISKRDAV